MTTKRQVRCTIYTRKSTEEGLEQDFNSLDAQREACAAYITSQKAEGWIALRDHYDDGGFSGGTLERPALKRLLRDIEAGKVDVVVVYKIDRLSRSLMDFAKLVEAFDRRAVTFVSVTQSFNTTTSMGRLTLNVLLSFAQFEREVTGERIRDKIAASKRKGMWMGGNPPLGYDVANRKLVVNPAEAEIVRTIFQRYLDLGCVRLLCSDLGTRGVVSKQRILASGRTLGGKPIGRSALHVILSNRAYIGEVTHKDKSYIGEHEAIVPRELFDAVQQRLRELAPAIKSTTRAKQDAPYAGLLFDETGAPMLPTYTIKSASIRYRYYASSPTLKGERSTASIQRVPAPPFEAHLAKVFQRLGLGELGKSSAGLRRITVKPQNLVIELNRDEILRSWQAVDGFKQNEEVLAHLRGRLNQGERLAENDDVLTLNLPVRAQFRGGHASVSGASDGVCRSKCVDPTLVKAVARAHQFRKLLEEGEFQSIDALAKHFKMDPGHLSLTLNLASLNPTLTRAILYGEQPPGLSLTKLLQANIPLTWRDQASAVRSASLPAAL